jgi:hypothetical protein
VPEAESFNECVDNLVVRHNLVGERGLRIGYECQFLPANRSCLRTERYGNVGQKSSLEVV